MAILGALCLALPPARAVTLQRLSMDELIGQSTAIIRGRVLSTYAGVSAGEVFTHVQVQVSERWKGTPAGVVDIVFPGGANGTLRQTVPGVPQLQEGREYVLYLWTSRAGLTFVTGFQQGIFAVSQDAEGQLTVQRPAASEMMLDRGGRPVADTPVHMPLQAMSARVALVTRGASR